MTSTASFEVCKKYKDTRGDTFKFIGSTTSGTLVFERLSTGLVTVRKSDGTTVFPTGGGGDTWDILPQEVREPRKVEGIAYVNEYEGERDYSDPLSLLFGFDVELELNLKEAKYSSYDTATRVGVKYKVTFEEILD